MQYDRRKVGPFAGRSTRCANAALKALGDPQSATLTAPKGAGGLARTSGGAARRSGHRGRMDGARILEAAVTGGIKIRADDAHFNPQPAHRDDRWDILTHTTLITIMATTLPLDMTRGTAQVRAGC